jgi:CheY-like chemotaxis protein
LTLKKSTRTTKKTKAIGREIPPDQRAANLEEANKVAGYVAHELNNLLTVIQINAEFLLGTAGDDAQSAQELADIQTASRRASVLARQLLASSRLESFDVAAAEAAVKQKAAAGSEKRGARTHRTPRVSETILLVEDEATVRSLAKRVLTQHGYRVLEASDGTVALRLAAGHVGEIDLVLTDVAMPNLGGRGMVEELRELSPGLRVLFMSGHPKDEIFPDREAAARVAYLQKPFTSETLSTEVRAALGYAS